MNRNEEDVCKVQWLYENTKILPDLLNSLMMIIGETDPQGRVIKAIPDWLAYTGQTSEEMLGYGWLDAIHEDDKKIIQSKWINTKTPRNYNFDFRLKNQNCNWRWCNILATPICDEKGTIKKWIGFIIDTYSRKESFDNIVVQSQFLSCIEDAVIAFKDGIAISCNDALLNALAVQREDIIGFKQTELIDKFFVHESKEKMQNNLNNGRVNEVTYQNKDGETGTFDVIKALIKDSHGRVTCEISLLKDITERIEYEKMLQEKEQDYLDIIDSSSVGSFIINMEKIELHFSHGWKMRLGIEGLSPREAAEAHLTMIHPDDIEKIYLEFAQAFFKQSPRLTMEFRMKTVDSGYIWILGQGNIKYNEEGKPIKYYGTHMDITERKQNEAVILSNEKQAKLLVEELKEMNRQKNNFISILSHELRNPLASIMNGVFLLKQSLTDHSKVNRIMNVLERQTLQLTHLVDDLLEVSRLTHNTIKVKKSPIECNELIKESIANFQQQLKDKDLAFVVDYSDSPIYIQADSVRMMQVAENLLSNAVKFTKFGGTIQIGIHKDDQKNEVIIVFQDTGIGMDSQFLPMLFKPFAQANNNLDRRNAGLGLGLTIVKEILDLHGGSIEVFSEGIDKGSRFTIHLPVMNVPAVTEQPSASWDASCPPLKILIIEDNEDLLEITEELLRGLGNEVITATNGIDGIMKAKEYHPEVLLCDIGLPGMSGYEIAETFCREAELKSIFRIALSGYAQTEDCERAKTAGFHKHLAKPLQLELLKSTLVEVYSSQKIYS